MTTARMGIVSVPLPFPACETSIYGDFPSRSTGDDGLIGPSMVNPADLLPIGHLWY